MDTRKVGGLFSLLCLHYCESNGSFQLKVVSGNYWFVKALSLGLLICMAMSDLRGGEERSACMPDQSTPVAVDDKPGEFIRDLKTNSHMWPEFVRLRESVVSGETEKAIPTHLRGVLIRVEGDSVVADFGRHGILAHFRQLGRMD